MTNEDKKAEAIQRVYNAQEGQIVSDEDMESIPSSWKELLPGGEAVELDMPAKSNQPNSTFPVFVEMGKPVFHRVPEGWRRQ